jgi:hypothetical protein
MFKKMKSVGSRVSAYLGKKASKCKTFALAVVGGALVFASSSSYAALADFVGEDATTGDPKMDPGILATWVKGVFYDTYGAWIPITLIVLGVTIVTAILWKRK